MSQAYRTEEQVAVAAVRRACRLTSSVFNKLVRKNEVLTKGDKSPVTGDYFTVTFFSRYSLILIPKIFFFFLVGDFATQALISSILYRAFPDDPIVGEEDASELRTESGKEMKDRIVELANEGLTYELELGDNRNWGIGPGEQQSDEQLLDAIDRGNYEGGKVGRKSSRCLLLLL